MSEELATPPREGMRILWSIGTSSSSGLRTSEIKTEEDFQVATDDGTVADAIQFMLTSLQGLLNDKNRRIKRAMLQMAKDAMNAGKDDKRQKQ
jgi:hypothetical protein